MNNKIIFAPLTKEDLPLFFRWVQSTHISKWWKSNTYEKFEKTYNPQALASNHVFPFIIQIDGKPIGYIQYYLADKADNGWWGIQIEDITGNIGIDMISGETDFIGKGYGSTILKLFIEKIYKETSATKIITDPDPNNLAAIRFYEKVGFRKIKEIDAPSFFDVEPCKLLLMELKKNDIDHFTKHNNAHHPY